MKIYTVEQGGCGVHGTIAFYTNREDAVAHLHRIHEELKKILKHNYDNSEFKRDFNLELKFNEKELVIRTHMYYYYIRSYDEGEIYESLYDNYI